VAQATRALADLAHIQVLRWHTRMPVAAPERVNDALAAALTQGHDKAVYVAVHANHPRELTKEAREACRRLLTAGVSLVSQTVLLKGVNDDPDTLSALMRAFVETRIKPYYLHHPDPAPGTGHFRVSLKEGQALMRALRARLSGLAMPTYVLDLPEARGKIPVGPSYIEGDGPDYVATDPKGGRLTYSDFG
jgi:lysine 2,3-aminomutase